MTKFILELYPVSQLYKQHKEAIDFLSVKLAQFNGGLYAGRSNDFLLQIKLSDEMVGITIMELVNNRFYFGVKRADASFVPFGTIYEVKLT